MNYRDKEREGRRKGSKGLGKEMARRKKEEERVQEN